VSWILNCLKWGWLSFAVDVDGPIRSRSLRQALFRQFQLLFLTFPRATRRTLTPELDQLTFAIHLSPLGVFLFLLWAASHVFRRLSCRTSAVPSYTTTFRFAQRLYYLRSGVQYSFESQRHSIERDRQGVRRSLASYVVSRVGCQQSYGRDN